MTEWAVGVDPTLNGHLKYPNRVSSFRKRAVRNFPRTSFDKLKYGNYFMLSEGEKKEKEEEKGRKRREEREEKKREREERRERV
jgi:hypothetical protein